MKRIGLIVVVWILSTVAYALPPSAAFYYGPHVPVRQLQLFNTVVVEPAYVPNPKKYETKHSHWYAYVSVGEVSKKRDYYKQIKRKWILGENKIWDSKVVDQTNPKWRQFFVGVVLKKLWDQGYRGFFLDTMDSYQLVAKPSKERAKHEAGLVKLIKEIKKRYPKAKLILNRGFELLPDIHGDINGITAESLYYGYDFNKKQYKQVSVSDREWLLGQFKKAKDYGLDVYAIDYMPLIEQKKARADAKRISDAGFIPWVSDISLENIGVSTVHVIPREVVVIYSSKQFEGKIESDPVRFISMPLNYMGYYQKLYDIRKNLPQPDFINKVAGVVVWMDSEYIKNKKKFIDFIKKTRKQNIPIVFFSNIASFRKEKSFIESLDLFIPENVEESTEFSISRSSNKIFEFESKPRISPNGFYGLQAKNSDVLLKIKSSSGETMDAAAITSWGGYVIPVYFTTSLPNKQTRYIINPFKFLQQTLRLPKIPIPDVTTENGRRILITHVDGDGLYSRSEWPNGPYAGESLLRTILDKYRIPATISIVEGEIGLAGLKPTDSPKLEKIARAIFKLPWVEIANHSYSHPFAWGEAYKNTGRILSDTTERLNIPNYRFSLKREIIGSTDYIDEKLAPANKKCKVFLWTGDTDPPKKAVAMTYKIGLLNMNSGNTTITKDNPSLTAVSGMGVYKGKWLQVFAPIQNENMYTNLWTGPFYGYKRVVETFQMTNKPRRLKPIDIYYHFYSASKISALKALDFVYDWTLKQPVTPEFSSTYIKKAVDFYTMAIGKSGGAWLAQGDGSIKEFRQPDKNKYPKLNASVMGFNTFNSSHYIHTSGSSFNEIKWQDSPPTSIYLHDSNAILLSYKHEGNVYTWKLKSYIPLITRFSQAKNCQFTVNGEALVPTAQDHLSVIQNSKEGSFAIQARC